MVISRPRPSPKALRATPVMSSSGTGDAHTKRDSARWERYVMGPISTVTTSSGHRPPRPALMGRNSTPAPTAVPKREIAQLVSNRRLAWPGAGLPEWGRAAVAVAVAVAAEDPPVGVDVRSWSCSGTGVSVLLGKGKSGRMRTPCEPGHSYTRLAPVVQQHRP